MNFHAALALQPETDAAARHLVAEAGAVEADLGVLFTSHHHGPEFETLLRHLHEHLDVRNLIGCTGESIIGPDREIENQPAAALWLADLPGVRILPFLIDQEDLQHLRQEGAWIDRLGIEPGEQPSFVVLADPFTFDIVTALDCMDRAYPGSPKVGGMASGAEARGQNRLFLNDQVLRQGLVGVALSGPIAIETVVSQGCRPIGKPFVVTKAQRNIIGELGGQNPYQVVKQLFAESSPADRQLMQRGFHVGVVIDEHITEFKPGDFLIHNVLGFDERSQLAISNLIRVGQTIQFHVRDADSADTEMRSLLAEKRGTLQTAPSGGLLFSCNGRGRRLFQHPNHDIGLVNDHFQSCPVAGFFAQGEIGPVGGRTFVHGFTSSLILFRETA